MSETNPENSRGTATPSAAEKSASGTVITAFPRKRQSASVVATVVALAVVSAAFMPRAGNAFSSAAKPGALVSTPTARSTNATRRLVLGESLLGRSKKLRVRFVSAARSMNLPILRELFGDTASEHAGLYAARTDDLAEPFHFITMRPFADKVAGRIGQYNIGFFPSERRAPRSGAYNNPEGFIEVSSANQFTPVSQHFTLSEWDPLESTCRHASLSIL